MTPTTTTITSTQVEQLLLENSIQLHGIPQAIVSDRGPNLTTPVLLDTFRKLGIQPRQTVAYHPQANGQVEHINQVIETYLKLFTN